MKLLSVGALLSLCLTAQVSRSQEPMDFMHRGPEMENQAYIYANSVLAQADQMIQAKDQGGAIALLNENFDRLSRLRAQLFGKILEAYLAQDNIQAARDLYLPAAKQDKELARAGAELLYSYYVKKQDANAVLAWTKQLTELPLPDDLMPAVYSWRLKAVSSREVAGQARQVVKDCAGKFAPPVCRTIFAPAVAALIEGGKYDDANRLLDSIDKACPNPAKDAKDPDDLRSFLALEKTRIIFLQKRWPEGETAFKKAAVTMADGDLAGLISFIAGQAKDKEQFEAAGRLCLFTLVNVKDRPGARNAAAADSLRMLKAAEQPAGIAPQFEQLLASGLPPNELFMFYYEYFYYVILKENPDWTRPMLVFGAKLKDKLDRPDDSKQVVLLLMDGAFVAGDYDNALQIMEANKKYWDNEWLDSTRVKMQGHIAMKNKNYKAAVECFRKYMDYVAKKNQATRNPVTGQLYTVDMLLGFNALRIGNILRENLKDEDGARKAYDEAEQYFNKSKPNVKPDSLESKYIDENLAQIAAQKKK